MSYWLDKGCSFQREMILTSVEATGPLEVLSSKLTQKFWLVKGWWSNVVWHLPCTMPHGCRDPCLPWLLVGTNCRPTDHWNSFRNFSMLQGITSLLNLCTSENTNTFHVTEVTSVSKHFQLKIATTHGTSIRVHLNSVILGRLHRFATKGQLKSSSPCISDSLTLFFRKWGHSRVLRITLKETHGQEWITTGTYSTLRKQVNAFTHMFQSEIAQMHHS